MFAFVSEIFNLATDAVRCARDRRLSRRLLTRDHVHAVKSTDLWFWKKSWQQAEDDAKADLKAGRYADYGSASELAAALGRSTDDAVLAALRQAPPRSAP